MNRVMEKARILLVDEDKLFRMKVRHTLEREEGMEIVGECTSAEEDMSKVEALFPGILLMDNCLPGIDGREVCRRVRESHTKTQVIYFTAKVEMDPLKLKGLRSEADAFIAKLATSKQILASVNRMLEGARQ